MLTLIQLHIRQYVCALPASTFVEYVERLTQFAIDLHDSLGMFSSFFLFSFYVIGPLSPDTWCCEGRLSPEAFHMGIICRCQVLEWLFILAEHIMKHHADATGTVSKWFLFALRRHI
jgi:hypothetical protein